MAYLLLTMGVLVCLLVWLYARWRSVRNYWSKRNVPHLPPHPLLGSMTFLMKKNMTTWMRENYTYFQSPFHGVWLFWRPALIINSPKLARRVLVTDASVFRDRLVSSKTGDPHGLNLFTADDPFWSALRRRISPVFTPNKFKIAEAFVLSKARELVRRIKNDTAHNKVIDLRSLFGDYSTDIISVTSFGVASNATYSGDSPMRRVTKSFLKFDPLRGLYWCCVFFIPELAKIIGCTLFEKRTTDMLREICDVVVKQRREECTTGDTIRQAKNLLETLMKIKEEGHVEGKEIPKDFLLSMAIGFLQAGVDTTSVSLSYAVYELAFAPHVQDRLYEEIFRAKQCIGDKELDGAVLSDLAYLNCTVKETFRKYHAMGWLDRVASKTYQVDENLTISAGTPVYVNISGIHYDPTFFPDPHEFVPDRFMPENEIRPFTYMPFGEGPRHCIGRRLGMESVRFALAHIVLNLELRPILGAKPPAACQMDQNSVLTVPADILSVQFIPRKEHLIT